MIDAESLRRWSEQLRSVPGVRDAEALVEGLREEPIPLGVLVPSDAVVAEVAEIAPDLAERRPSHSDGGPLRIPPGAPTTLVAALRAAAELDDAGTLYLGDPGEGERFQTYRELLGEAERILGGLRAAGLDSGSRVLFQLQAPEDFLPAFWACVLGGILPVPSALPGGFREENAGIVRLRGAWELLGGPPVLTRATLVEPIRSAPGLSHLEGLEVLAVEDLRRAQPVGATAEPSPGDAALLLLTSGSTGVPKGVVLDHGNLMSSAWGAIQMHGFGPESRFLNWFPLDHVAGIVMFHIQPLVLGGRQIHGPMEAVLKQPVVWLDWIECHRATVTWAPNFAYGQINEREATLGKRQWDLSSMRFILNGGEAIVPRTVRRFLRLLAPHGLAGDCMHPGWGMSETSGGVVFSQDFRLETTSDDDSFVSLGGPFPGTRLRIVDDAGEIVPEPRVGKLQIQGPSITRGYLGNPEATKEGRTEDGWFDTGDLGSMTDGRLTITGRTKETIIINGLNYHGHEIETAAEEGPGLVKSFTAACAVRGDGRDTDELAVFFSPSEGADLQELVADIRSRIVQAVGLHASYLIPLPQADIPKTSIGKIQRSTLVQRFQAGEFDTLLRELDADEHGEETVPDWFYRKAWLESEGDAAAAEAGGGRVLALVTDSPSGRALVAALTAAGHQVETVRPGSELAEEGPGSWTLPTTRREGWAELLRRLRGSGREPDRVVLAWPYRAWGGEPGSLTAIREAQGLGSFALVRLLAALDDAGLGGVPTMVVAARSLAVLENEPVAWEHGALAALVKTARQEGAEDLRLIDLEGSDPEAEARCVTSELVGRPAEAEVAWRGGRRLVSRLERIEMASLEAASSPLERGGLFVLPGGLGGIGVHVARLLMERLDARVLVLGRTPLPPREEWPSFMDAGGQVAERLRAYRALEATGGSFDYQAVDVTDLDGLKEARRQAERQFSRQLSGIVHLAGVHRERHWEHAADHRLAAEDESGLARLFEAKLYGTWALYRLLEDRPEASFVAMSSVLSEFGGSGNGAYAAAGAAMAALVAHRRGADSPRSYCYEWSMWDDVGMSRDNPRIVRDATRASGFHILEPQQGLLSLLGLLSRDVGHAVVGVDGNHAAVAPRVVVRPGQERLRTWVAADDSVTDDGIRESAARAGLPRPEVLRVEALPRLEDGSVDREALQGLADAGSGGKLSAAERRMAEIWQQVLSRRAVGPRDRFFEVGGDSLKATQLLQRVSQAFGVDVPLRDFFDDPTVSGLAGRVAGGDGSEGGR